MKLTIDLEKLQLATDEAGQIILDPSGEENLIKLLDAQEKIDDLITKAKARIEEEMLKVDPNLTTVIGRDVRIGYRFFGKKFEPVEGLEQEIPGEIVTKVIKYELDSKKVEDWEKEHGIMPEGVMVRNRKKAVTFSRLDKDDEAGF